jgi:UDP-3-O-[3-hydroxymyristoyl] glucosamine N-acyltransferase
MKLKAIADLIGARLKGNPDCLINGLAPLEQAKAGDLSFLSHRQYKKYLGTTGASAVIIGAEDEAACTLDALISENPRLSLAKVAKLFEVDSILPGIHPTALIGEDCEIADSVSIGAYTVLGNRCKVGAGTVLKSRVTLYDDVKLGSDCLIHSGAVIGSDGFGFANDKGAWVKMPHLGGVSIGNNVEIGANTAVDRGFLEDTTIGDGVIIDNLVQVGHNVSIGLRTAIAGCVAIAGSTSIGEYCLIGGGASIAGHIQIADHVHITAVSSVNHSLALRGVYSSGFPAKASAVWRKNVARFQYLDEMAKRLRHLERLMEEE